MRSKVNRLDITFISFKIILVSTFMILFETCADTDKLTHELAIGQTLVSSNQMFELGFFNNSNNRYIGIWYKNISGTKPVWVANRENPLSVSDTASVLTIASDGNLKLLDGTKKEIWSTKFTSNPNNTIATLSDTGDFIVTDNSSGSTLWESFNYPSNSLIAGMKIEVNPGKGVKYELNSWKGENDPSPGDFIMGLTMETPSQNIIWKNSKPHWRSGPWSGSQFIGLLNEYWTGFEITTDNQQGSVVGYYNPPSNLKSQVKSDTVKIK